MSDSVIHVSDGECLQPTDDGFYVPRCQCGWSFGPVPEVETLVDALMDHAFDEAQTGGR